MPSPRLQLRSPILSIIIPVHNQWSFTSRCLDSLRRHTPDSIPVEIIVVDDASTDSTWNHLRQECRKDARVRAVRNETNLLFAKTCNRGALEARAPRLLFLNNDTEAAPGWLPPLLAACSNDPCAIAGARLLYPNSLIQHAGVEFSLHRFGNRIHPYPIHRGRGLSAENPRAMQSGPVPAVTGACLMIKTGLFCELNGFDERYRHYFEDIDLCLRASLRGKKTNYCPASALIHHESASKTNETAIHDLHQRSAELFLSRWSDRLREQLASQRPSNPSTIAVDAHPFSVNCSPPLLNHDASLSLFSKWADAHAHRQFHFHGPSTFKPSCAAFFNQPNVIYRSDREYFPEDSDLLIIPDPLLPEATSESPFVRLKHARTVVAFFHPHPIAPERRLRLRIAQLRKIACPILAPSEESSQWLRSELHIRAERLHVIASEKQFDGILNLNFSPSPENHHAVSV